ncbi:DNA translocase FtsK [Mangrovicella endophytica]|uniref:DNA translocase FtsK n=1 Tax=Mangrovicella endophytica TaxID=2066697 RepID=UPI001FE0892A|nr:DNA translocase FtsK [Mangrovicella endophytica]
MEIGGALALFGLSIFTAVACGTWTVTDPSLSQANQNAVANWAGAPGAIVADLAMQIFGLGAALLVALPAIWGGLLIAGLGIGHVWRRAWFAVGGIVLASAAVGCFAAPAGWPLPIGLGGVAGDLVLKFPALATGAYPQGVIGYLLAAMLAVPAGWLFLNGAGLIDRHAEVRIAAREERGARINGRHAQAEDDEEDGEGRLALVVGALAHVAFSAKSAIGRRIAAYRESKKEFGDRFDDWRGEPEMTAVQRVAAPAPTRPAMRPIRVSEPAPRPAFVDPLADADEDEDGFMPDDMAVHAATPARMPEPARAAPQAEAFDDEDDWADAPAGVHADGPLPWDEEPEAVADDGMMVSPGDRVSGGAPAAEEEQTGWRGLLAGNIIAFPGRKGAKEKAAQRAAEPSLAPAPRAPMPAERSPVAGTAEAPARVVPQANVTATQQKLRTGSGRAVAPQRDTAMAPSVFELPSLDFLTPPKVRGKDSTLSPEVLQENARILEGVLDDFGVKGEIIEVRPGPVVTLYELEPAPGIKSSRVIGLADDIARSMSAIAARVAVIPGKNAIGIELPNQRRETVYLREMMASESFTENKGKLALTLGKTIGGEPVIADLAKMPHLLVAGTTGSGKSVAINTMITSLLYRMTPAECRMIMIDPKMLELSIYDGIPHLLSPVVTDPKKAVVALKWTVREMEDRYRKMSKVGVRNIDGFNTRVRQAMEKGETISRTVQTGFDRESGEPIFETEEFDLQPLPYIVVIIDEMADLMMVAGKDIEGAVQRLAQMARAAGIHVIMATQRPSVDVITGTIKANFPTRISFQVTSKIDSRTILGEQGAEQLLGQGDMLFMAGGGRIQRVHGPFVDDGEVEKIVTHLKSQGAPDYLDAILVDEDEEGESGGSGGGGGAGGGLDESADLYDQAVAIVLRDGKASTSYVQRRLGIGYNRAASIIERMEKEGVVGPANHAGKREILVPTEAERM